MTRANRIGPRLYDASENVWRAIISFYDRTLSAVLRHQTITLLVFAATLGLTVLLFVAIPKGFFPIQDTGVILGVSEAPQAISFGAMSQRQQALTKIILGDPAVASATSFIGIDGTNTTLNSGRIQINLKPLEKRKVSATEVIARLGPRLEKVPGIRLFMQPVQDLTVEDRVSRTQFQYTLEDPDAAELGTWVAKFVAKLRTLSELADVASDQQELGLQAKLTIDRDTASRLGITPQMIDDALYDAFGQRQISQILTQSNQYHVVTEVHPDAQRGPADLNRIYVRSSTNGMVPLSAFTRLELENAPLAINRQGQFPAVTISFNLAPRVSLGEALNAIDKAKQDLGMPESVQANFQGTAAAFRASLKNEWVLILAALVTVYIVLGVLYESYVHPITILSTLPSAGVGALLALMCRMDFDIIGLIGLVLLIGIVKKNGIMMIDFALEMQRHEGKPAQEAIHQACLLRLRPILMTTMAALLAGVPMAFGHGVGAELRRPLGITMIGGLLLSQALTLYTTPVIYLFFERMAERVRASRARADAVSGQAVAPG
jgi:multidrug efflux pump